MSATETDDLITIVQAARELGYETTREVRRMWKAGEFIPFVFVNRRRILVSRSALQQWIAKRTLNNLPPKSALRSEPLPATSVGRARRAARQPTHEGSAPST